MMITICTKNHPDDEEVSFRLMVDERVVCDFLQPRRGRLSECLRRAADAVEMSDWIDEVLATDAKGG